MLKLKYNTKLKKQFLAFWQITKLDDYEKKIKNKLFYISRYQRLSKGCRHIISDLIHQNITNKNILIKNNKLVIDQKTATIKANTLIDKEKELDTLDTFHLITIRKNRSSLINANDTVHLSEELIDMFSSLPLLKENEILNYPKSESSPIKELNENELSLFTNIYTDLFYDKETDIKILKKFIKNKLIIAGISPNLTPVFFTHIAPYKKLKKPTLTDILNTKDSSSFFIHSIDAKLFKLITRSRNALTLPPQKVESVDEDIISEIAGKILSSHLNKYQSLSFYKKIYFILKTFYPKTIRIYSMLAKIGESGDNFQELELYRNFNIVKYKLKSHLPEIKSIKKKLAELRSICLIHKKKDVYSFDPKLATTIFKSKKESPRKITESLIIDSDLHITAYREKLAPALLHFFLSSSKVNYSEYTINFALDHQKMSLALFNGFTPEKSASLLKRHGTTTFSSSFNEHIRSFYSQTKIFHHSQAHLLKTYSNEFFKKAQFLMDKESIPYKIIVGMENTIILFNKRDLEKTREMLSLDRTFIL